MSKRKKVKLKAKVYGPTSQDDGPTPVELEVDAKEECDECGNPTVDLEDVEQALDEAAEKSAGGKTSVGFSRVYSAGWDKVFGPKGKKKPPKKGDPESN